MLVVRVAVAAAAFAVAAAGYATLAPSAAAAGTAQATLAQQRELAERYAPVVRLVVGGEGCGPGLHYVPIDVDTLFDEPTVALRGPWGNDLVQISPTAEGPRPRALGLPPRLPRQRAPARLRLPPLAAAPRSRARPHGLRAHRERPRAPGQARAPVLVLLRLQRLEQPARGRLGDDPDRLRRVDGRRRRSTSRRSRSGTASTKGRSGPPGTIRSSSASARTRSSIRPTARTRTSTERRCISAAPPRRGSAATTRAGRPSTCGRAVVTIPSDKAAAHARVSVDRVRGPLGRAPSGVLQRARRAEPQGAVDASDHLGGGLAQPELHRARQHALRAGSDRLLLRCGRARLAVARAARGEPARLQPRARRPRPPGHLPALADDVAAHRSAPPRPPARLGADAGRLGADVRRAVAAVRRTRASCSCRSACSSRSSRRSCCTRRTCSRSRSDRAAAARRGSSRSRSGRRSRCSAWGVVQAATARALIELDAGRADRSGPGVSAFPRARETALRGAAGRRGRGGAAGELALSSCRSRSGWPAAGRSIVPVVELEDRGARAALRRSRHLVEEALAEGRVARRGRRRARARARPADRRRSSSWRRVRRSGS